MEQSYELTLIDMRRVVLGQSQNSELYIPLQGKHTTNLEEEPFDLAQKINEFFVFDDANLNDPRVMLLMGDTGSGKSVFAQQVFQQLLETRKKNDSIPVWIPLPELLNPFEGAVEEVLKKQELTESQIVKMKANKRFIFIVDGYDELHQFQNCYMTNKWNEWKAKVLITCRSQALYYQKDPDKYFVPFQREKRLAWLLRKLYVAPFSQDQIRVYVERYNQLHPRETKIKLEDIDRIPGLKELITTPFLLHLTIEALPDILADVGVEEENSKMTQAKLYDVFIERWFMRQVKKLETAGQLKIDPENTKQRFWDYCKRLAQQMHANEVTMIPYLQQKVGGRLFGKPEKANRWESFFNEETEVLRSACPLKRMGDYHYGFIHASFVEYFATRAMYEEIQEQEVEEELPQERNEKEEVEEFSEKAEIRKPRGGIHHRVFAKELNGIRNLADRIEMEEKFKRRMLDLVEYSKKSERYATGAANAISALVRAGVTFNGADLRGVRIAGADLSGGYFAGVNLEGSDLTEVVLARTYLWQGKLRQCQLTGIIFGEYPWIKHENSVWCIDYREDLNRLVTACGDMIMLWDLQTGHCLKELRKNGQQVTCVQFRRDGQWVVSGSYDRRVRLWELATGKESVLKTHKSTVNSVQFSADGQRVVSGSNDFTIWVCDLVSYQDILLQGHEGPVNSVQFSSNGQQVVSGSDDKTVRVWDVASGEAKVLRGHESNVYCVQFSCDDQRVVSGSVDKTIRVWDLVSGQVKVLKHIDSVMTVHFSEDGQRVVSGSYDHTVRVWDLASGHATVLRGHESYVKSVQFIGGDRVVSGSEDKTVRIWDVATGQTTMFCGHEGSVWTVHFSGNGQRVVTGSEDDTIWVWDVASGQATALRGHESGVYYVQFSSDGQRVVSGSRDNDNTVRIWEMASGRATVLGKHDSRVNCVHFSEDGKRVVSGSYDRTIRVWDLASGQSTVLRGHEGEVTKVQFSGDGQRVVSGSADKTVRIWDLASGQATVLRGHKGGISCVQFSPDEQQVVSGSSDNTVRVWDVASGQSKVLWGHETLVRSVLFSRDGQRVVSGSQDNTVRVWEVVSGQATVFRGHQNWVMCLQLSEDSQRIISGSTDNTIRVWDIDQKRMISCLVLHEPVLTFALDERTGLLCVGFQDGIVQCWQVMRDDWQSPQLQWSSSRHNPALFLRGCDISETIGLSDQNTQLITQRNEIDSLKVTTISTTQLGDNQLLFDEVPISKNNEISIANPHVFQGQNEMQESETLSDKHLAHAIVQGNPPALLTGTDRKKAEDNVSTGAQIGREKLQIAETPKAPIGMTKFWGIFKKKETAAKIHEKSAESESKKKGLSNLKLFNRGSKAVEPKSRNKDEDRDDTSVKSLGRGSADE